MDLTSRYRVKPGARVSLARHDPADTAGVRDTRQTKDRFENARKRLGDLQDRLYAMDSWAVLLLFQAMDSAGKDSTIKRVLGRVNPQGCQVFSFKAPSNEELDHDFLWRSARALPERGRIGVHNRSHYEEVVITRVHPEILARQRVPALPAPPKLWAQRFRQINEWERHVAENGTLILKFFLNVSKEEQRRRFLARLEEPEKHWKFSPRDVAERARWKDYMRAYQDAISHTSTAWAPWFIVPADHKWFTRLVVAEIACAALDRLQLRYPAVPADVRREWELVKKSLTSSGD
jgi:PPK2 family polyphosphate:nucleotide phosphotransferase